MAITPLPPAPSRSDPATFATKGDALLGALAQFVMEANALLATCELKATTNLSLENIADALVPAGTIRHWPAITPPSGWLVRDGSAISRTAYPDLFAVLGTTYGAGNGSTTFNLPDDRELVIVGYKTGSPEFGTLGGMYGAKTHTLTADQMPNHNHQQDAHYHAFVAYQTLGGGGNVQASAGEVNSVTVNTVSAQPYIYPAGGSLPHNNVQPSRAYLPIIKY